jgi:hypothetical protein
VPSVYNSTILEISADLVPAKRPIDFPRLRKLSYFASKLDKQRSFPWLNLFSLELSQVFRLKKLFPEARRIPVIIFDRCIDLEDISDLGENKSVKIRYCHKIKDFRSLKNGWNVLIERCDGFSDGNDVENVRHLTIYSISENFSDTSPLEDVQHLTLSLHWTSDVLKGIWDIPVLEISFNIAFTCFPHVQLNNEKIIINHHKETLPLVIVASTANYDMTRCKNQFIFIRKRK